MMFENSNIPKPIYAGKYLIFSDAMIDVDKIEAYRIVSVDEITDYIKIVCSNFVYDTQAYTVHADDMDDYKNISSVVNDYWGLSLRR